jgi:exoribonuclease II
MADEPSWLTMSEAAERSGLHRDAIRSRARRGLIPSRRDNRGQWLVQLTADALAMGDQANGHDLAMVVTDLQAEIADLRVALARAEADRDAAKAVAMAEVMAKDALVAELRKLLDDARRPWWRRWLAAPS